MVDEGVLEVVRAHMRDVRTPGHHDKVYKDECMLCFATAESPGGLYTNLQTWQAFGEEHLELDHGRTGCVLYLQEVSHRVPLTEEERSREQDKPDKLAIGVEGGFQVDAKTHRVETEHALVVMPARLRVPLPCPDLPELVIGAIGAIQAHDSASAQDEVAAWQEERLVSKYADALEQLPCNRTIPMDPGQWKCDETGVTNNLWLNLSTGFIGSGRPHFDGSGGNGAALRHFEATGKKYPLVVKLGTITPSSADVYSYAEDECDMVLDPHLATHLAHWGINMMRMDKTEKTMAELQIEKNMAFEFDKITEAGAALQPLHGPGYTGLKNLGNSCYMNSVLQLLWALPELKATYVDQAAEIFASAPPEIAADFACQFAKVGKALVEGVTGHPNQPSTNGAAANYDAMTVSTDGGLEAVAQAKEDASDNCVKPQMFKSLVGRGHAEFSSSRQQDAEEYFSHLLEVMTRAERAAGGRLPSTQDQPTAALFKFELETRIECAETHKVSYRRATDGYLGLEIPLEAATNRAAFDDYREREQKRQKLKEQEGADVAGKDGEEERVIPNVPFAACLEQFLATSVVDDYKSAAAGKTTQATKQVRFATFPRYLLVQMRRYYVDEAWTPKKMEVLVDVPEHLSLQHFRAQGLQPGEELQPEEETQVDGQPAAAATVEADAGIVSQLVADAGIVSQLVAMGFSENGSKRAALATNNAGAEVAMEWVLSHMADADFNEPIVSAAAGKPAEGVNLEGLPMLTSMGFTEAQATAALTACQGSVERAADWLFSHVDDLESAVASVGTAAVSNADAKDATAKLDDGIGEYELAGFISHMGANTACGHYVCHIKKDGRWVIFNDEKVALSEQPPKDLGYFYLFHRVQ